MSFLNFNLIYILSLLLFLSGCVKKKESSFSQNIPSTKELHEHSEMFTKRIEKVGENIYVAIGYGLANSIMIEGDDGVIIVDCMESIESATEVKAAFDSITSKPVKGIIYTHFHTDHTFGSYAYVGESKPQVIAQELLPFYLDQTASVVRTITEKRAYRMFGVFLEDNQRINCGIGPELRINENTKIGVLRPSITFKDSLKINISGINMELYHVPGETPDHLMVWLPESKTLLSGDNIYKTFPNLYTIRGTSYRDVNLWKNSIDQMRKLKPEVLIPSHTEVVFEENNIYNILTDYRDAIQYVHDQTVRGMNKGMTPDELVEFVILPKHLQDSPWLKEFYGKTEWSVKNVFTGYMGFFDGNPTTLLPLKREEKAKNIEKLAGGKTKLLEQIEEGINQQSFQWVLELTDYYLVLYPKESKVIDFRVEALTQLGAKQSNPNARNYYLTSALELKGLKNTGLIKPTAEVVRDIPIKYIFNSMATYLDPIKSQDVQKKVLFIFTDTGSNWTVEVRRGVAEIQPFDTGNPDITIEVSEQVWKELAAQIRNPVKTFLNGEIKVTGGQVSFKNFMNLFDIAFEK